MGPLRTKLLGGIVAMALLFGFGYYYRDDVGRLVRGLLAGLQPCQRPITYSIANLDPRFGLTKQQVLNDIQKAEKIWESPIDGQLFEYSPTGDLKISFVYDNRQKATDALKKIGIVISNDRASYDALKAKYDQFIASYNSQKARLDSLIATYTADKNAYEKDVRYWNSRGGAPRADYAALERRRMDLNNQVAVINQTQSSLNALVDTINSAKVVLDKLIATLNLNVSRYNTTGSSNGAEFNEGIYTSDVRGAAITIFQFNDTNQLVRVLAHELGHALGLGHIDNPKAIMYYLNEGSNDKLTTDDLAALKQLCRI